MLSSRSFGEVNSTVIIECPGCHSKYQYGEERFEGKPSKKIRCSRCQHVFEIRNADHPTNVMADLMDRDTPNKKPQETTAQAAIPKGPPPMDGPLQLPTGVRLSLAILDGPDAGSVHRVEKPRVTIGRSGADLALNDTEVSRAHAVVEIRDTSYSLSDLGSTNGTMFEGARIDAPVLLSDKSEFQIGTTTLMLIVTDEQ